MPFFDMNETALRAYRSAVARPHDFADFWAENLAEAQQHPVGIVLDKLDTSLRLVEIFDLTFNGAGGHPIRGWLIQPAGATNLPCLVKFLGYNGGRGAPHEHLLWPTAGYAVLVMDTRGRGSGWSLGQTPDPVGSDPSHPGFLTRGILSPRTYYYRRVFTDAMRAIETARSLPQIDPNRIAVCGASQGGGIALATAGVDSTLRAAMIDVPFLCDFPRATAITGSEPYVEIARFLAVHRTKADAVFETLRYFDGTCFAPDAQAPALFSAALMDVVCPPSTVYAAFNVYGGIDKTIHPYPFNDHEGGGAEHQLVQLQWLADRL